MLWRKFKLDWQYAIGELLIVVAGVLVALAIDQWNDERLERREADEILQHLLIDLHEDLKDIDLMIRLVREKQQSLLRLKSVFDSGERPANDKEFLQDIVTGANFGWNQVRPNDTTYQEVLSSGKLSLIRRSELRSAISLYYFDFTNMFNRADERETMFPHLSYQLVPRHSELGSEALREVDQSLTTDETTRLVDDALRSSLAHYVIGEMNLAKFILRLSNGVQQRCEELIAKIENYRGVN
jgi:hypothetical protein